MRVRVRGVDLEYETFGSAGDPPMVLVMGFAQQLIAWDDSFCQQLAARRFHVVRFDNRDIGLSTKFDSAPRPDIPAILGGDKTTVAYAIHDMADDTAGLIQELRIRSAHLVRLSVRGIIAQSPAV